MANKGRNHVDAKRNEYGNAYHAERLSQLTKMNHHITTKIYNEDSPQFEVYVPRKSKRGL
jgi:hypothetical protein